MLEPTGVSHHNKPCISNWGNIYKHCTFCKVLLKLLVMYTFRIIIIIDLIEPWWKLHSTDHWAIVDVYCMFADKLHCYATYLFCCMCIFREMEYDLENLLLSDGHRIHSLVQQSFVACGISEASPAWQEFIMHIDAIILQGLKNLTISSMAALLNTLLDHDVRLLFFHT